MTDRANSPIRPDLWAQAWQVLASDRLLLLWLGLLAAAALASFWFPQIPQSAFQENGGLEKWMTPIRAQLDQPADTLLALGLLSVARAPWLRIILAGTALSLLLRAFDSFTSLTSHPSAAQPAVTQRLITSQEGAVALESVSKHLGRGFRHQIENEPLQRLIAHRPLAHLGPLLTILGGLIIISGWIWTQMAGWELTELRLTEEMSAAITPIDRTLHLDTLEVDWSNADSRRTASGQLKLEYKDSFSVGKISFDQDWQWHGVTFSLMDIGPAIQVTGIGADGQALLLQTAAQSPAEEKVTLLLPVEEGPQSFAAPNEGVVIQAVAESTGTPPVIRLHAYLGRDGELVEDREIDRKATLNLGEALFTINIVPYAEIRARFAPGWTITVIGIILAMVGAIASLGFRRRQLEVVARPRDQGSELVFSSSLPKDSSWLTELVNHLGPEKIGDEFGD